MHFINKIWKIKQVKISFAIMCIIVVLAAAFIFQPGPDKNVVYPNAKDSGHILASGNQQANNPTNENLVKVESLSPESSQIPKSSETPGNLQTNINSSNTEKVSGTASILQTHSASPSNQPSSTTTKDKYQITPSPSDKPKPVEPGDVTVNNNKKLTCTISIRCDTILDNMDIFNKDKLSVLPSNGMILQTQTVTFSEGESVFDILKRVTREERIHMEFSNVPIYNSAYIKGINNLYEFDCGNLSGWVYKVNNWFPNYGCSRYVLKQGDVIEWLYTCDLGKDVGGGYFMYE